MAVTEAQFLGIKTAVEKLQHSGRQPTDIHGHPPTLTIGEVFGLLVENVRHDPKWQMDEADAADILSSLLDNDKSQINEIIRELRPRGYDAVVTRLGETRAKARPGKRPKTFRRRMTWKPKR